MHALGIDTWMAAQKAGAKLLMQDYFIPRSKLIAPHEFSDLENEAARHMVGIRYPDLNCSLSLSLYNDPVMTCDGFVYERECIENYWYTTGHLRSPLTNLQLENSDLRAAIIVKRFVEKFLSENIESGKAAALAGSNLSSHAIKAREIEIIITQISAQPTNPSADLMLTLLGLLENVYLRDFASRCGALSIAAVYFAHNKSEVATDLLVRMLTFSLENQQQMQFIACEAEAAVFSDDFEVQVRGFRVLTALVADGGTLQNRLESSVGLFIKPIVDNLVEVPTNLCKSVLLFAVHLLQHKRAGTSKLVHDAGICVLATFVLDTMISDPVAVNLVCWVFSLLSDLPEEVKKTFQNTPALEFKIYEAIKICGSFGLEALAVLVGTRRSVMRAVEVLTVSDSESHARGAALRILAEATIEDERDQAVFGKRPLITDVVEYICRNIQTVFAALASGSEYYTLKHGLRLLRNIVCAIDHPHAGAISPVARAVFLEQGAKVAEVMWSATQRIVVGIHANSHTPSVNPMDVEVHTSCAEVFGFFRHFIRLLPAGAFPTVLSRAKVDVVGACIDVLHFAKTRIPEIALELPEHQAVISDMVGNALSILQTWCTRIEYHELGHTSISKTMLDLVASGAEPFAKFLSTRVLETLHVLVCSSEAPARFCMLRGFSAANHAFRREVVRNNMHSKVLNMLRLKSGTEEEDLGMLALLRDTVAEIRTHSKAKRHTQFYQRLVPVLLEKIQDNIHRARGCPVTVMICTETLANLLVADAVPHGLLRGSPALARTMLAVLQVFGVQSPRPTFVLEQALRVVVLVVSSPCACWASSAAGPSSGVLRDARAVERLLAAERSSETLQTAGTLLWLVRSPADELFCTSRWCGFEHLAHSHAARCAELVLTLTLLVLGEHPDPRVVDACVGSALFEAVFPALEGAGSMTLGAKTLLLHTLERLLPRLPAALAAQGAAALALCARGQAGAAEAGVKRKLEA